MIFAPYAISSHFCIVGGHNNYHKSNNNNNSIYHHYDQLRRQKHRQQTTKLMWMVRASWCVNVSMICLMRAFNHIWTLSMWFLFLFSTFSLSCQFDLMLRSHLLSVMLYGPQTNTECRIFTHTHTQKKPKIDSKQETIIQKRAPNIQFAFFGVTSHLAVCVCANSKKTNKYAWCNTVKNYSLL